MDPTLEREEEEEEKRSRVLSGGIEPRQPIQ
jgi:hypothetical protein